MQRQLPELKNDYLGAENSIYKFLVVQLTEEQKQQLEAECTFTASRSSGPGGQNVKMYSTVLHTALTVSTTYLENDLNENLRRTKKWITE